MNARKKTLRDWLLHQIKLAELGCEAIECEVIENKKHNPRFETTRAKGIRLIQYGEEIVVIKRFVFRVPNTACVYRICDDNIKAFKMKVSKSCAFKKILVGEENEV